MCKQLCESDFMVYKQIMVCVWVVITTLVFCVHSELGECALPLSLSLSLSTFRNKRLEENKYLEEKDSIRQRSAERSVSTVPVFL